MSTDIGRGHQPRQTPSPCMSYDSPIAISPRPARLRVRTASVGRPVQRPSDGLGDMSTVSIPGRGVAPNAPG